MEEITLFSLSWIIVLVGVFFSAYIYGLVGFGFALLLAPLLLFFTTPRIVVVTNLFLCLFIQLLNIFFQKSMFLNNIKPRIVVFMFLGGLLGLVPGYFILKIVNPSYFKIIVGSVIIFFSIALLSRLNFKVKKISLFSMLTGFCSGFLATSTSLAGPPVVLFLHGQNLKKENTYCTYITYWLLIIIASLTYFSFNKYIDLNTIILVLTLAPVSFIGTILGIYSFHRIPKTHFYKISIWLIIFSGFIALISGVKVFFPLFD